MTDIVLVDKSKAIPKSMAKLCILDILHEADEEHPLTQGEIRQRLKNIYEIDIDRKTVHAHLRELIDCVECIRYSEKPRSGEDGSLSVLSDFWIEEEEAFEEVELLTLIFSVIFNKHMPARGKKDLLKKLEGLSSSDIHRKLKNYFHDDAISTGQGNELWWNLEALSEAIECKKKVSFEYKNYKVGNGIYETRSTFTVNPLAIGMSNGDFFLVAQLDAADSISPSTMLEQFETVIQAIESREVCINTYRLDHIKKLELLDEPRRRLKADKKLNLKGSKGEEFYIQEYLKQNPNLKSGYSIRAGFLIYEKVEEIANELIELFGKTNVKLIDSKQDPIYSLSVKGNINEIKDFALRNISSVDLIEPEQLHNELLATLTNAVKRMSSD